MALETEGLVLERQVGKERKEGLLAAVANR